MSGVVRELRLRVDKMGKKLIINEWEKDICENENYCFVFFLKLIVSRAIQKLKIKITTT